MKSQRSSNNRSILEAEDNCQTLEGIRKIFPAGKERAYKVATADCNLIVIPYRIGLVIATAGAGYPVGTAIDAMTIKSKFQNCMAKNGVSLSEKLF